MVTSDDSWFCSCPDFEERQIACEHALAVEITCQRESNGNVMTYSETVKVPTRRTGTPTTWPRRTRKALFVTMLVERCKLSPPRRKPRAAPGSP